MAHLHDQRYAVPTEVLASFRAAGSLTQEPLEDFLLTMVFF